MKPSAKPECWLGDLVSAVAWCERQEGRMDPVRVLTIAEMLGFSRPERPGSDALLGPAGQAMDGSAVGEIPDHSADTAGRQSGAVDVGESAPARETPASTSAHSTAIPFRLRPPVVLGCGAGESDPPPMWLPAISLAKAEIARISNARPYAPLLAPQSSRASLQIALQRSVPEGPPDVRRLVELVARRDRFPVGLPKTMVPTLRYGAQVLCDLAESMDPFRRDQDELVTQLRMLIGDERTDARWFEASLLRGCSQGASGAWGEYSPPEPGRPVLVLSNFGLSCGPGYIGIRREWSALVGRLRRRDCKVIALVPAPPARWPRWLVRLMPLICWDRSTTVGSVAVAVRRIL